MNTDRRLARGAARIWHSDTGGNSGPVVLTHGAGLDHTMWDVQARALADAGHRVIRWDMRAHGTSTCDPGVRFTAADAVDDLEAVLDACAVESAVLVGHSLGGNLSQAFTARRPDRVAGLVVVDATWNAGTLSALERLGLRVAAPSLSLIPRRSLPGLMARASAVTPAAVARATAVFARMPKSRFLEVWAATTSLVRPEPGYRSPVPLALVRGEHDRTGNIATAMPRWAAAERVPEHIIPAAGHIVTWDAPAATSRVLLGVLDGEMLRTGDDGDEKP